MARIFFSPTSILFLVIVAGSTVEAHGQVARIRAFSRECDSRGCRNVVSYGTAVHWKTVNGRALFLTARHTVATAQKVLVDLDDGPAASRLEQEDEPRDLALISVSAAGRTDLKAPFELAEGEAEPGDSVPRELIGFAGGKSFLRRNVRIDEKGRCRVEVREGDSGGPILERVKQKERSKIRMIVTARPADGWQPEDEAIGVDAGQIRVWLKDCGLCLDGDELPVAPPPPDEEKPGPEPITDPRPCNCERLEARIQELERRLVELKDHELVVETWISGDGGSSPPQLSRSKTYRLFDPVRPGRSAPIRILSPRAALNQGEQK